MNSSSAKDSEAGLLAAVVAMAVLFRFRRVFETMSVYLAIVFAMIILTVAIFLIVRKANLRAKQLKPKEWSKMGGLEFEDQIVIWLKAKGYNQVSKTSYFDQGIDILAAKPGLLIGVQVKRSAKPVGVSAVRAAVSGVAAYGCQQAMVVTNNKFTSQAIRLALVNNCLLVDGAKLLSA